MRPKYCLPIINPSLSEVNSLIDKNILEYDFLELWLDYIEGLKVSDVKLLRDKLGGKGIFLFRRQSLEPIKMSLDQRLETIQALDNHQSLIDLDVSQKEELEENKDKNIHSIVSYHNYSQTPNSEKLREIIDEISSSRVDIYKVSTLCNTNEDALRLLDLLLNLKERGLEYIVLGMGEKGAITRIFGTLWGNKMIYAPEDRFEQSAPGQLTKEQLEGIFSILGDYGR